MIYKVCVIEDEDIIRNGLIKSIDWESYDCTVVGEAKNGIEGLKVIAAQQPDIILLDINMPIMDGLELLSRLPKGIFSIIVLSGYSDFNYAKKAIEFGVCEYLLKPLDHNELYMSLERAKREIMMRRSFEHSASDISPYQALVLPRSIDSVTVNLALDYVAKHYQSKITLSDIRKYTGRSTTHINSRFQSQLQMTFNEFLGRYRIEKALEHIKTQKYHLYEIAELVGFKEYKYFNLVFQKYVGSAPKLVSTYYARINTKELHRIP